MSLKVVRITTLLDFGGQEQKYLLFTENPSLLHHSYFFAAIGHGGHASETIKARGFSVTVFEANPKITQLKNIWLLYRWFRSIRPDVVHTAAAEANFHGVLAARLAGVKVVIAEEIGHPNHSALARFVFKFLYRLVTKVVCVSRSVKDYLITIGELQPEKGMVIYNPVRTPKVLLGKRAEVFTIVSVGRLEKVKNQQLLIKALSALKNKQIQVILVGDGRERTALEQLIRETGLTERVRITGFSSEPERYLAQAHLFVLPSLSEGFGIAAVEAMQQGIPCLCSEVGGIPEFITDGETGWLFNPEDEAAFTRKLEQIISLPEERLIAVGANGKAFVSNRFTPEHYVMNLEQLYETL